MAKRCRIENSEFAKRAKFDALVSRNDVYCEDYQQECDKITIQVSELGRKNRAYISETQNYKTWLAESNQRLRKEQAVNEKLKEAIENKTQQRDEYKKRWQSAVKDLNREKIRSTEKKDLEERLINQMHLLNAERTNVSTLNQRIQNLEEKLKAAEEHNAKLTSLLVKFPPPRMWTKFWKFIHFKRKIYEPLDSSMYFRQDWSPKY